MSIYSGKLPQDFDWTLFIQYLLGICPSDRKEMVEGWLSESKAVRAIRLGLWGRVSPELEESASRVMAHVEARIAGSSGNADQPDAGVRRTPSNTRAIRQQPVFQRRWGVSLLAMSVVIAALGAGLHKTGVTPSFQSFAHANRLYTTVPGQRAHVTLSDGTRVILNVATRLSVPRDFGSSSRTVILDGEAQFVVVHNAQRPFVIKTANTTIRDLTTSFTVRAYKESGVTKVAVRDGAVSVQPASLTLSSAATVSANQLASVASDGMPRVSKTNEIDKYFAWTDGRMVFHGEPLGEALVQLSRWYGVEFRASDSTLFLLDVNGELPVSFNLEIIRTFARTLGARAEYSGNTVTLVPIH